jgi:hypothetical protein
MPRAATIAQADISRIIRAVKECGYDCIIEFEGGKIAVKPFEKQKELDEKRKARL